MDDEQDQIGVSGDELQMVFTEHGLARAIGNALEVVEGGDDCAERGAKLAQNIFLAAMIERGGLVDADRPPVSGDE